MDWLLAHAVSHCHVINLDSVKYLKFILKSKEQQSDQKLRGGYYTPMSLATFIARWVAVGNKTNILEPSCGDGVFLDALACSTDQSMIVTAFELDAKEASKAKARAAKHRFDTRVWETDFLDWADKHVHEGPGPFDAVVGNPPFIRYQYLPENFQVRAESIFRKLGCKFTKLTNAWVPFILAAIALLRPGGRLGMVVPSELIHIGHAESLRTFLTTTCSRLVLIDPERLWFSETLQGAVILLAEKCSSHSQPLEGLGIEPVTDQEFLERDPEKLFRSVPVVKGKSTESKWTRALLDAGTLHLIEETEMNPSIRRFKDVADVNVGIVTGANKFFLVPNETVARYSLYKFACPMFGRSQHCPGVVYNAKQHKRNAHDGKPTNFLWFKDLTDAEVVQIEPYLSFGESQNIHERYKCRIRSPWYCVPSVYATEVGMPRRAHNAPRLIFNQMRAFTTDTTYRIKTKKVESRAFVGNFLNPLTALSAELEGRYYGGGVLELVPSEVELLLVPIAPGLRTDLETLDQAVQTIPTERILAEHGRQVLSASGIEAKDSEQLLHAWLMLKNRRQRISLLARTNSAT